MGNVVPGFKERCPDSRQIQTTSGPIVGRRLIHEGDKLVDAFQGIPYAEPPVGERRFRHPEPVTPWTEVRETKAFGARGIQKDMFPWIKYQIGPTSEDNLTLNVFTPVWTPPTEGFAVLVFIHGGGFVSDSCVKYGDIGICQHLVTKNVVVVTLQYRLGFLGFWTTGDESCPGNMALWDMTLALKWIKDNASAFNGDPNNITVMGQSAGGASVDLLSICPESRDLFHKVIPMAGNASADWALDWNAVETCRKMAVKHGVDSFFDSSQYLSDVRKLPAHVFAIGMKMEDPDGELTCEIGPRLDGVFIPKQILDLRKEAPAKPRMIGCCHSEGLICTMSGAALTVSKLQTVIALLVREKDHPHDFKQIRREILLKVLEMKTPHTEEQVKRAMVEIFGDMFLNISCQHAVLDCVNTSEAPVYFYSFNYFNPKMFGLLGSKLPFKDATHCCELAYIFGVGILSSFEYTEDDMKMIELTTTLWTNFAKYGDPNGASDTGNVLGDQPWLPADKDHPQRHLEINMKPVMNEIYKTGRPMIYINARQKNHQNSEKLIVPDIVVENE